jgi:general secretion pathway protein G
LREEGYTLLELILVIAIIGLLSSMAIGRYIDILIEVKFKRAIFDLRSLENAITLYSVSHGLPETLSDLDIMSTVDPWGSPYRYLPIEGARRGEVRKDRFLVPLNSDYDLYSMGPDGMSRPPLTAGASRDDIIRAGNGSYVGPANEF